MLPTIHQMTRTKENTKLFKGQIEPVHPFPGCSLGIGDRRILHQLKQNSPAKLGPHGALYLKILIRCVALFPAT